MRSGSGAHMGRRSLVFSLVGDGGRTRSDERVAGGDGGRFASIGRPELAENVADVVAGGLAADEELVGDLRIGQPLTEECENLSFAPGEIDWRRRQPRTRNGLGRCWRNGG